MENVLEKYRCHFMDATLLDCISVLQVVEGEAQSIVPEQKTSKVVVKILHEDATTIDQMYFLHEVKPYRELDHPNILKLLGRCLETDPFLVLLEACPSVSAAFPCPPPPPAKSHWYSLDRRLGGP
jgi:hypothetical protein